MRTRDQQRLNRDRVHDAITDEDEHPLRAFVLDWFLDTGDRPSRVWNEWSPRRLW